MKVSKEENSYFYKEIYNDLISKGYKGEELTNQIKIMQEKVRPAVKSMLFEAEKAADNKCEFYTYNDIF